MGADVPPLRIRADFGMSIMYLVCVWVVVSVVVVVVTLMMLVRYQRSIWSSPNTLPPTNSHHPVIPRYATRPIPFPNRCQNRVHQHFQHHARLRLRISSMNCCGYAHCLGPVHEKYLSMCHLKSHIYFVQASSCSSM